MARLKKLLPIPILCVIAAVLLSPLDLKVATILAQLQLRGDLGEIVTVAETFGHGIGVIMVLIAVWMLSEESRRYMPALLASSLGAGMVANVVKLLVARQRPRDFHFATENVMATFGQLMPGYDINMQSFPSAHSATGIGFAIALAAYFPRGKWLFYTLAGIASFSRMHVGAHFMSDVLIGSAIGIVVAKLSLVYLQVDRLPKVLSFVTCAETNVSNAPGHKIAA